MMRKITAHFFALVLLAAPFAAWAEPLRNPLEGGGINSLPQFLNALLGIIIQIGFPIIVLFIVFIGFRFVQHSAEGNADKLKDDRSLILWAILGALILLGAQALAYAICVTTQDLGANVSCNFF